MQLSQEVDEQSRRSLRDRRHVPKKQTLRRADCAEIKVERDIAAGLLQRLKKAECMCLPGPATTVENLVVDGFESRSYSHVDEGGTEPLSLPRFSALRHKVEWSIHGGKTGHLRQPTARP